MNILQSLKASPKQLLKALGIAIVVVIVLAILLRLLGFSGSPASMFYGALNSANRAFGPSYQESAGSYGSATISGYADMAASDSVGSYKSYDVSQGISLSPRNISPVPPTNPGTTGSDAENYEVTQYHATYETKDLKKICGEFTKLKPFDYVIFENASEGDTSCSYTFKVAKQHVAQMVEIIKSLNPRDFQEERYTIKRQIEDFTSEQQILEARLKNIDDTLRTAMTAYDEISRLSTQTRDADALARVINSKIQTIQQLSQQKIDVSTQLERLSRSKAEQLDRLDYKYFYVSIYELKYIDGEELGRSWQQAVKSFVYNVNGIVQDISIGLVAFVMLIVQYVLYLVIVLLVAKLLWKFALWVWKK